MAVRYASQVEEELDEIWIYVAQESGSTDIANRMVDSITDHFFLLSAHPQMGRRRDHDLRPGLRSLSVGGYVVVYRIDKSDVLILHVVHGRRDIRALLRF
jgi:toxin ParE1/3/4